MAKDNPGRLDAVAPADLGCSVMPELVGMPVGYLGCLACSGNPSSVGVHIIVISRSSPSEIPCRTFLPLLGPLDLGWLHRRVSSSLKIGKPFGLRVDRGEQVCLNIRLEKWADHHLC